MSLPISFRVVEQEPAHYQEVIRLLQKVKVNSEYPPRIKKDASLRAYRDWLDENEDAKMVHPYNSGNPATRHWVALAEISGEESVIGHIQISPVRQYLIEYLETLSLNTETKANLIEVSKLFVDPDRCMNGVGSSLFNKAGETSRDLGFTPILTALISSPKAVSFYTNRGGIDLGTFDRVQGDRVHRVFTYPNL